MKERKYSKAIANAIKSFLTEDDWNFTFNEDQGTFRFGLAMEGKLKKISYIVRVNGDNFTVYATSPLGPDTDDSHMMSEVAEFICTNYECCTVLANDDITACIHGISADVTTLYGRDMWDGRLTKNRYGFYDQWVIDIHDDMVRVYQGETDLAPDLSIRAFDSGVSCIVFPGDADEASLKAAGCVTTPVVTSSGRNYILACPGGNRLNGEE